MGLRLWLLGVLALSLCCYGTPDGAEATPSDEPQKTFSILVFPSMSRETIPTPSDKPQKTFSISEGQIPRSSLFGEINLRPENLEFLDFHDEGTFVIPGSKLRGSSLRSVTVALHSFSLSSLDVLEEGTVTCSLRAGTTRACSSGCCQFGDFCRVGGSTTNRFSAARNLWPSANTVTGVGTHLVGIASTRNSEDHRGNYLYTLSSLDVSEEGTSLDVSEEGTVACTSRAETTRVCRSKAGDLAALSLDATAVPRRDLGTSDFGGHSGNYLCSWRG
jgi:hypothetical protein